MKTASGRTRTWAGLCPESWCRRFSKASAAGLCGALICLLGFSAPANLPHPDDIPKQIEHLALLAIVPESAATAIAVQSGHWSDPATWDTVPGEGGKVLIPQGLTVTVDTEITTRLDWIRVNGTLRFAPDANTGLIVSTIVVDPVGTFHMGASAAPEDHIQADKTAKVIFADFGEIDRDLDPFGLGRGLISHGAARIHGAPTTSYAFLSQPAVKGSVALEVEALPENWKIGGRLVLPSTIYIYANAGDGLMLDDDEELTITDIGEPDLEGRTTITLNRPLKYDHLLPAGVPAYVKVPLAYLDRNAVLVSENAATSRRGHVMFMHNANVQVADALFEQLGRTDVETIVTDPQVDAEGNLIPGTTGNDRGRYSLHVHRTVPDPAKPATIRRVSVINSPKFGIVNHDSNVICEDSVVYDAAGSAFFTEIGSEIGAFRRNLAIRTVRGGGFRGEVERFLGIELPGGKDFGSNGNGFWFQGGGIEVVDNMAFKTKDIGFVYLSIGLVTENGETMFLRSNLDPANPFYDAENTGATIRVNQIPVRKFSGNVALAAYTGFMLRKHNPVGQASLMEDSTAANISTFGIDAEYGGPKTFRRLYIHGGTTAPEGHLLTLGGHGEWGFVSNENSNNLTVDQCEFRNFLRGMRFTVSQTNRIVDTVIDSIQSLVIENGPNTTMPTTIERVSFLHTLPLLERAPFNRYEDIEMFRPHGPVAPVTVILGEPGLIPDPEGEPPPQMSLFWGVQNSRVYYALTSPDRPAEFNSASAQLPDAGSGPIDFFLPLTVDSPGQSGAGTPASYRLFVNFDKFLSSASVTVATGTATVVGEPQVNGNQVAIDFENLTAEEWVSLEVSTVSEGEISSAPVTIPVTMSTISAVTTFAQAAEQGPTPGIFTISRLGAIDAPLTVHYAVAGNATPGLDYVSPTGTVDFLPGQESIELAVTPLADTTAEGTEEVKLSILGGYGTYVLSNTTHAALTIADLPLHVWRTATFGAAANDPAIGADSADPDFDLRNNFLEFALASNPLLTQDDPLPRVELEDGALHLTYRRPVQAGGLVYLVEESIDGLQSWQPADATLETISDDGVTREVKASVPIGSGGSKLIRLQITRP